jgi:hypothetical protein
MASMKLCASLRSGESAKGSEASPQLRTGEGGGLGASSSAGATSTGDEGPIVWLQLSGSHGARQRAPPSSDPPPHRDRHAPRLGAATHGYVQAKMAVRGVVLRSGIKHSRKCSRCLDDRERGNELHHRQIICNVPTVIPDVQA